MFPVSFITRSKRATKNPIMAATRISFFMLLHCSTNASQNKKVEISWYLPFFFGCRMPVYTARHQVFMYTAEGMETPVFLPERLQDFDICFRESSWHWAAASFCRVVVVYSIV